MDNRKSRPADLFINLLLLIIICLLTFIKLNSIIEMVYAIIIDSWVSLFKLRFYTITVIYIYFNTENTRILSNDSWKCFKDYDILCLQPTEYYKFWTFEIKNIFILHFHVQFLSNISPTGIFSICISITTSYILRIHDTSLSLLILLVTTILMRKHYLWHDLFMWIIIHNNEG